MSSITAELGGSRRIGWLIVGDVLSGVFAALTFAGTIFVLFVNELGFDNVQIGLLLSLVPFCGVVAPFIAPLVSQLGFKRVYVTFWGLRKVSIAFLLLTPFVATRFDQSQLFLWIAAIIFGFALCRAIAETGGNNWKKDVIPDNVRGKVASINHTFGLAASILIALVASYVLNLDGGIERYMLLMGFGLLVGIICVFAYTRVPSYASPDQRRPISMSSHIQGMRRALHDRNFLFFLAGLGLATIGSSAVYAFIPLFMKQEIGLSAGAVVLLGMTTSISSLLTSLLWGWTTDRYGSKPVMQFSLSLMLLLPVVWFLLPRNHVISGPLAFLIAFVMGVATLAWQISWLRYLYINVTPQAADRRPPYLAVYYAWFGVVSGLAPLLAGYVLNSAQNLDRQLWLFQLDPYTPLFLFSFVFILLSGILVARLESEQETTFRNFLHMFFQPSLFQSLGLQIRYSYAGEELPRMETTERMGSTKNLLNVQELIEALNDPSFNVRYEAVQAIGRMPHSDKLVDALLTLLDEGESELSIAATRSLGKLGDQRAIPSLRVSARSGSPLLEANSARALSMLGDVGSARYFRRKLRQEQNPDLRIAYISALGKLQVEEAIGELCYLLYHTERKVLRGEIGLALARIVGPERFYLHHWRAFHADLSAATAKAIIDLKKPARQQATEALVAHIDNCSDSFERGELKQGIQHLQQLMGALAQGIYPESLLYILEECELRLAEFGEERIEYVLLALHAADCVFRFQGQPLTDGQVPLLTH